jgi:acetate kinase
MKILVLNCGSSSVKFQLIDTSPAQIASNQDRAIAKGQVEKIGSSEAVVRFQGQKFFRSIREHGEAIQVALECLKEDADGIEGVGHRVVHGGEKFTASVEITPPVLEAIEACVELAPLHNPHNLKGYRASRQLLPQARHVAVFDTAFHTSLPPRAYLYGLPYMFYARDRIRRYGFHGTSHRYVSYRWAQLQGSTRDRFKMITIHLGNGCSMTAIDHGRVVDTSLGYTPLDGLLMGTRCGDIDPGVILHILAKHELYVHELEALLNKQSGLLGLSGVSNDMRDLLGAAEKGEARAALAVDIFCYRIKKYLGAYLAALDGADAVIFTGGIGENAPAIRAQVCAGLSFCGIALDEAKNASAIGVEASLSTGTSRFPVWVIPTNEELLIARDTCRTILGVPNP